MGNDRFKFRVWDNKNNDYLPTSDVRLDGRTGKIERASFFNDPYTIEQCTGLKDKNGKLIYEGDILVFVKGATHPITVTWNGIGWKFIRNGKRIEDAFECNTMSHISSCEIICNIHETKENT